MKIGNLQVDSVLFCDDVRREKDTNKHILIGVFSGDMITPELPAFIPLSFYIDGHITRSVEVPLHIRLSGPGEGDAKMKLIVRSDEPSGAIAISGPGGFLRIESEGSVKLSLSSDGEKWRTVKKIRVIHRPAQTISSPLPASQSPPDAPDSSSPPEPSPPSSPRKRRRI